MPCSTNFSVTLESVSFLKHKPDFLKEIIFLKSFDSMLNVATSQLFPKGDNFRCLELANNRFKNVTSHTGIINFEHMIILILAKARSDSLMLAVKSPQME